MVSDFECVGVVGGLRQPGRDRQAVMEMVMTVMVVLHVRVCCFSVGG